MQRQMFKIRKITIGNMRDISFEIFILKKISLTDLIGFNFPLSILLRVIQYESFGIAILIIRNVLSLCIYRQMSPNNRKVTA